MVDAYITLQVDCQKAGHPLAAAAHTPDRWIAATAVALNRPLVSLDRIFQNVPGLTLL